MINSILYAIIIIILISPITYSFLLLVKSILKSPSFYEYQLLFSALSFIFWTILVIPIFITPEYFSYSEIIITEHIATIIGSFGVLFFVFSIINNFSYKLMIFPRITIIVFTIIIGARLIQLTLPPNETIYGFKQAEEELIRVTPPLIAGILILAYFFLYITLVIFILNQNNMPDYIIPEKTKQYTLLALGIFTLGISIYAFGTMFTLNVSIAGFLFLLSRLIITTAFLFIVLQFIKNPVITFSEKGNPAKFILNGTINWLLIGNRDTGPELLHSSTKLQNFFNQEELQLFSIKLLTSVNLGTEHYNEEICIIPQNNSERNINLIAVGFSFQHADPELKDPRKKGICDLVFAIVIPNILLPFLANITINAMRKPILSEVKKTKDLQEFLVNCHFNTLTGKLLKNLSQKKSF